VFGILVEVGHDPHNLFKEVEEFLIVEEEHEEQSDFDFLALIDLVHDVLHFDLIVEVFFEFFPVVALLLGVVLVFILHAVLEDLDHLAEQNAELAGFGVLLGERELIVDRPVLFVLAAGLVVELDALVLRFRHRQYQY
jgi:hypothetical protein